MRVGSFTRSAKVARRAHGFNGSIGIEIEVDMDTRHDILQKAVHSFETIFENFPRDRRWRLCMKDGQEIKDGLPNGLPFSIRNVAEMYGIALGRVHLFLFPIGKLTFANHLKN